MFLLEYKNIILFLALIFWFTLKRDKVIWIDYLGALLILASAVEFVSWVMVEYSMNNHIAYNVYMILEFVITTKLIFLISRRNNIVKNIGKISLVLMSFAFIYFTLIKGSIFQLSTLTLIFGGFLLAIQAIVGLFYLSGSLKSTMTGTPQFWILTSVLIYFLCFVPIFGLFNYFMEKNQQIALSLLDLNDVLFIIRYILIAIGITIYKKKQQLQYD